jgi:hypothetical protein
VLANGTIYTVLGNGTRGFRGDGGLAAAALVSYEPGMSPTQSLLSPDGNLGFWIFDSGNRRLRRVNYAGIITTVGGNGTLLSYGDGIHVSSATFGRVVSIDADGLDGLWLLDNFDPVDPSRAFLRHLLQTGVIVTVATFPGGTFGAPGSVARDSSAGGAFVSFSSCVVRKVSASGAISTFAGRAFACSYGGDGGLAQAATFRSPGSLAYDAAGGGALFVVDDATVRRITSDGTISLFAGSGLQSTDSDGAPATLAKLVWAAKLAPDGA